MTLFPDARPQPERRPPPRARRAPRVTALIVACVVVGLLLLLAPWDAQRGRAISDQLTIWFTPTPADVAALADSTGMSETGRRIFLASTPELDERGSFNHHCPVDEQIVLGCYSDGEIFLYRVTDERLAGTNEVTAAHEMLHAAYERLSVTERTQVDRLIAAYVTTLPDDDPLFAVMAGYPEEEQADELHSRLGTEFGDLGPELETYYARYFDDRSRVLTLQKSSTAALTAANDRIAELSASLNSLGDDIETRRARWQRESDALDADIQRYNSTGWTPDSDREYQDLRRRSDAREAERTALVTDIDHYNDMVAELDRLNASNAELYDQLDSMAGARQAP